VALFALISWFEIVAFLLFLGYIVFSLALDLSRSWKSQWKRKRA
jgi:hypothetical protein